MKQSRYKRLAPDSSATVDAAGRVVRYIFSDESVARDGHIVKATAWRTENFAKNPVFLWFHDDSEPPIGRVFDLHTENRTLCGAVKYAETEFAESIYSLVRDKMLNATSTSWLPIAGDHMSSGGICFTDVDLLEISQVALPALPNALATARSRGLNVKPIADWASRALDSAARPLPRAQLEAIFRSATPRRSTSMVDDSAGRALRKRKAMALLIQSGLPVSDALRRADRQSVTEHAETLQKVQAHHKRCLEHHEEIGRASDATGDGLDQLGEIHRRLTSTLEELGYGRSAKSPPKVIEDMQRCMRSLATAHKETTEAHGNLGEALGDASGCVDDLLDEDQE
jgi:phage head maturation protease